MKIKTFKSGNLEELDQLCNEFEETHSVKATQCRDVFTSEGLVHIYTLFYLSEDLPAPKEVNYTVKKG